MCGCVLGKRLKRAADQPGGPIRMVTSAPAVDEFRQFVEPLPFATPRPARSKSAQPVGEGGQSEPAGPALLRAGVSQVRRNLRRECDPAL